MKGELFLQGRGPVLVQDLLRWVGGQVQGRAELSPEAQGLEVGPSSVQHSVKAMGPQTMIPRGST